MVTVLISMCRKNESLTTQDISTGQTWLLLTKI